MKTRQELILDFMLSLAVNVMKDDLYPKEVFEIAAELTEAYLDGMALYSENE